MMSRFKTLAGIWRLEGDQKFRDEIMEGKYSENIFFEKNFNAL